MRRPFVTFLVLSCGVMSSGRAWSEPAGPPVAAGADLARLTLPEALSYARAHQPAIRAGVARVAARAEASKVPTAKWLPQVGATAQLLGGTSNNSSASYLGSPVLDIPRIGGTAATLPGALRPYVSTFVGVGLRQEVFDFGLISAQRAAADALVEVQRNESAEALLDVQFAVEESYFAVLAAKGVLRASEDAYTRSRAHRDLAKAGTASGMRSPIELTTAEATLSRFEIGRIRAAGGLRVAQSVLAAAIGAQDAAIDVAEEPPGASAMPALSDAMKGAAARDPKVRAALAALAAEEARTRAVAAGLRPDISLSATVSGRAGGAAPSGGAGVPLGSGLLPYVPNWDIGLALSWPLFDGVVLAQRDASRANEEVRRAELEVVRAEQLATIQRAFVAFDVARQVLPGLLQSVAAAQANYEQADARFRAGLGTAVELADAENLRASAEIDVALGRFDAMRARAAFGRAIAEGL